MVDSVYSRIHSVSSAPAAERSPHDKPILHSQDSMTSCTKLQYYNEENQSCHTCFPMPEKPERELLEWCQKVVIQTDTDSSYNDPSCGDACYFKFKDRLLAHQPDKSCHWKPIAIVFIVMSVLLIGTIIGTILFWCCRAKKKRSITLERAGTEEECIPIFDDHKDKSSFFSVKEKKREPALGDIMSSDVSVDIHHRRETSKSKGHMNVKDKNGDKCKETSKSAFNRYDVNKSRVENMPCAVPADNDDRIDYLSNNTTDNNPIDYALQYCDVPPGNINNNHNNHEQRPRSQQIQQDYSQPSPHTLQRTSPPATPDGSIESHTNTLYSGVSGHTIPNHHRGSQRNDSHSIQQPCSPEHRSAELDHLNLPSAASPYSNSDQSHGILPANSSSNDQTRSPYLPSQNNHTHTHHPGISGEPTPNHMGSQLPENRSTELDHLNLPSAASPYSNSDQSHGILPANSSSNDQTRSPYLPSQNTHTHHSRISGEPTTNHMGSQRNDSYSLQQPENKSAELDPDNSILIINGGTNSIFANDISTVNVINNKDNNCPTQNVRTSVNDNQAQTQSSTQHTYPLVRSSSSKHSGSAASASDPEHQQILPSQPASTLDNSSSCHPRPGVQLAGSSGCVKYFNPVMAEHGPTA